ncbi:unnamed protein product [Gulo gulo]|uniref:Uncharacterized protein n=1 Tax=Gulo gulo TaxID=48420 RepID=A0A9X9M052_GULGU|nr:unnamed protein product [Gulo gulo]
MSPRKLDSSRHPGEVPPRPRLSSPCVLWASALSLPPGRRTQWVPERLPLHASTPPRAGPSSSRPCAQCWRAASRRRRNSAPW